MNDLGPFDFFPLPAQKSSIRKALRARYIADIRFEHDGIRSALRQAAGIDRGFRKEARNYSAISYRPAVGKGDINDRDRPSQCSFVCIHPSDGSPLRGTWSLVWGAVVIVESSRPMSMGMGVWCFGFSFGH
jgi:hypothetical protein